MRDETSTAIRKRAGEFFASPAFDPCFERIHPLSRGALVAGLCLAPLFLRGEAFAGAWSKLAHGDGRSARLRRRYARLRETGEVIFTYVLICNAELKNKPGVVAPALVIGNFNEGRDEATLLEMRDKLAGLALGEDVGPEDREAARILSDISYCFRRRRALPRSCTGGIEVVAFDLMVVGEFLPTATLQIEAIPCLAEPGHRGLIGMIPFSIIEDILKNDRTGPQRSVGAVPPPETDESAKKPDHFSSIGFRVASPQHLCELATRATGSSGPGAAKDYVPCSTPEGAELWVQKRGAEVVGCNPHFAGNSRFMAGAGFEITIARIIENEQLPLDGTVVGNIASDEACGCPIVFDVPDFRRCVGRLREGQRVKVQIAGFAHEFHAAENEEAFHRKQSATFGGPGLAAQSFIPSGTFQPGGETIDPPQAYAILAGVILEAELRTNSMTGLSFYALVVKTLGGVIDVVVDPQLVSDKPVPGGIVSGSFWLSGRLLESGEKPPRIPTTPPPIPGSSF